MTHYLNLATKLFPESRQGGLMICGINWGGAPDEGYVWSRDVTGDSFFSDARFNDFPYRNRLLKWFELFGHSLATSEDKAGEFEKSIVQTNWLRSQSPNMRDKDLNAECVSEWGNFEFHIARLQPKLLMFMGVQLLDILNSPACAGPAERLLGPGGAPKWEIRDVRAGSSALRALRVGFQKRERAQIVAFPHPTGTVGLSDDYIAAFFDVVSPLISQFKAERGFAP